jgi:hypothetical protein
MLLSHVDVPSGLPRGDLVLTREAPQNGWDGKAPKQHDGTIDAFGVLACLSPPAFGHVP